VRREKLRWLRCGVNEVESIQSRDVGALLTAPSTESFEFFIEFAFDFEFDFDRHSDPATAGEESLGGFIP
jgi:hypothetical protein